MTLGAPSPVAGSVIRFSTDPDDDSFAIPFTSLDGTVVDPDIVQFAYSVQGGPWVVATYTWGTGDPSNVITRAGVGLYRATIDTTGLAGFWSAKWSGSPSVEIDHDSTHTQVVYLYSEFETQAAS